MTEHYLDLWTDSQTVGGLPHQYRQRALTALREPIARRLDMDVPRITFGLLLYDSLGLRLSTVRGHPDEALLRTRGENLSLTLISES